MQLIILGRKLKAKLTGNKPCSYTSNHGHELELPSINRGNGWAWFRCSKCNAVLNYNGLLGCFDDIIGREAGERWECEK